MKRILIVIVIVIGMSWLISAQKKERVSRSGESRQANANSGVSKPRKSKGSSVRQIQVTFEDIARVSVGRSYIVDLTRRGVVYNFDYRSRPIDFGRIRVRNAAGELAMESWMRKQLPKAWASSWKSGLIRLGAATDLKQFFVRHPRSSTPQPYYYNEVDGKCYCSGDDDCNDMFSDDVCLDIGECYDADTTNPHCSCSCP